MQIQVTSRKFRYQLVNGDDFTTDAADYTPNLCGHPMERVQLEATVTLKVATEGDGTESFVISGGNTLVRDFVEWVRDGWQVGDTFASLAPVFTGTILTLDSYTMTFSVQTGTATNGTYNTTAFILQTTTVYPDVDYKFNVIENSEGLNFISKADNTIQSFALAGLTAAYANMLPAPGAKSWKTGETQIKVSSITAGVATYTILQEFILLPYYQQQYYANLTNGIKPDFLSGDNAMKHVFEIRFRKVLSNKNGEFIHQDADNLGSSKWFGSGSLYTFAFTEFKNAVPEVIDGIEITGVTTLFGTIASAALFTNTFKIGAYVSALIPPHATQSTDDFKTHWKYDNELKVVDTANAGLTGIITRLTSVLVSSSLITFEIDLTYSAGHQADIYSDKKFNINECLVAVLIGDPAVSNTVSVQDMGVVKVADFTKNTDTPSLISFDTANTGFLRHDQVEGDPLYTSANGAIGDSFIFKTKLITDLDATAYIHSVTAKLICEDCDGNEFTVLEIPLDISAQTIVPAGLLEKQAIELDVEAGYKLPDDDIFNQVVMTEYIEDSAIRFGEHTSAVIGYEEIPFTSALPNAEYDIIITDRTGTSFDLSESCDTELKADANSLVIYAEAQPRTLAYVVKTSEVLGIMRTGTVDLATGVNNITFLTTLENANYSLIITDWDEVGHSTIVKSATGFTITAVAPGRFTYSAVQHVGMTGIRAGSQAISVGANSVTFSSDIGSTDYTLLAFDRSNTGNITSIAKFTDGFTFTAAAVGLLEYQTFLNP